MTNRTPRFIVALLLLLPLASCHYMGPAIRLHGTPADISQLNGEWSGEFAADSFDGRRGSIFFSLRAGAAEAHGDVLMNWQGPESAGRYGNEPPSSDPVTHTEVLTIRFVRATDGNVSGELDPYWDPDRKVPARAVFTGRVLDDRISGTFTVTFATGAEPSKGRWNVRRTRTIAR